MASRAAVALFAVEQAGQHRQETDATGQNDDG